MGSCCTRVHLMSYCISQALNSHFTTPLLHTCKLDLAKENLDKARFQGGCSSNTIESCFVPLVRH